MSPRGLVPVAVALALALAPEPAHACSCSSYPLPSIELCKKAPRAFAGTVEAVEAPFLFEQGDSSAARLRVDKVWRGDPPAALLAYSGGPCGSGPPTPGWSFVMCDDDVDDGTWTVVSFCRKPLFGEIPGLDEALGPGHAPTRPPALHWQPWRTREFFEHLFGVALAPLVAVILGASGGWLVRRRALRPGDDRSSIRLVLGLAVALVVVRLVLRALELAGELRGPFVAAVTVALATLVGLGFGYRGQRRAAPGKALRGLGLALLGAGLLLFAGFVRLHFPLQPGDAVACSEARAREFLRTVPIAVDLDGSDDSYDDGEPSPAAEAHQAEALQIAADAVPYACTDWGLRRMHFDPHGYRGPCVEFDDALGGTYRLCARQDDAVYSEEPPG